MKQGGFAIAIRIDDSLMRSLKYEFGNCDTPKFASRVHFQNFQRHRISRFDEDTYCLKSK